MNRYLATARRDASEIRSLAHTASVCGHCASPTLPVSGSTSRWDSVGIDSRTAAGDVPGGRYSSTVAAAPRTLGVQTSTRGAARVGSWWRGTGSTVAANARAS